MSLRTIQRVGITSGLLLGAVWASGCDDGNGGTKPSVDAGTDGGGGGNEMDSGGGDGDGDGDAATPDAGGPQFPTMCEGQTEPCATVDTGLLPLKGCCDTRVGENGVCGGVVAIPGQVTALDGCHGLHQEGAASTSCGAFFDAVEGDSSDPTKPFNHTNGTYDVLVAGTVIGFPGCCSNTGYCGVNVDQFMFGASAVKPMLGCVPVTHFSAMMAEMGDAGAGDADAGAGLPDGVSPFCVPTMPNQAAGCPPTMEVQLPGQPALNLCQQFADNMVNLIGCTATTATPDWICQTLNLTSTKDGQVPAVASPYCMEMLPKPAHGCAPQETKNCVPGVAPTVFGCEDIPAVPGIPETVCGCGVGVLAENCIPNVPKQGEQGQVCGADQVEAGNPILASYPKFLCGCDGATDAAKTLGCLNGVDKAVCGSKAETEYLPAIPEFIYGCGPDTLDAGEGLPCMNNVAKNVHGTKAITASGDPALAKVPEYLCGCGDDAVSQENMLPCLPNVALAACGAVNVPAGVHVPKYPSGVCGCVATEPATPTNTVGEGDLCLDNVINTVCGAVAACTVEPNSCPENQICVDVKPSPQAPDGLGDACAPLPPT